MVVTFYGTEISKNYAPQLLSACAFETAFSLSRKTLVLQFYQKYPVETLLLGKQTVMGERDDGISDDTGIETLLRKTKTKGLKEDHFSTYTKQIISSNSKNNFDVATVAKLADFRKEVVNDLDIVKELIETANRIYNAIFILADGKDPELINMLNEVSDKKVICIEQSVKQKTFCADEKTIYLVPNYDENSLYTVKYLKKLYSASDMFYLPYNVSFNDSCKQNNILRFLYENNDKADSINGAFIKNLKEITAHIIGTSVKDMNSGIQEWNFKKILPQQQEEVHKRKLNPEDVDVAIEKKHFFSRKKTVVHINKEETHSEEPKKKKKRRKKETLILESEDEQITDSPKKKSKKEEKQEQKNKKKNKIQINTLSEKIEDDEEVEISSVDEGEETIPVEEKTKTSPTFKDKVYEKIKDIMEEEEDEEDFLEKEDEERSSVEVSHEETVDMIESLEEFIEEEEEEEEEVYVAAFKEQRDQEDLVPSDILSEEEKAKETEELPEIGMEEEDWEEEPWEEEAISAESTEETEETEEIEEEIEEEEEIKEISMEKESEEIAIISSNDEEANEEVEEETEVFEKEISEEEVSPLPIKEEPQPAKEKETEKTEPVKEELPKKAVPEPVPASVQETPVTTSDDSVEEEVITTPEIKEEISSVNTTEEAEEKESSSVTENTIAADPLPVDDTLEIAEEPLKTEPVSSPEVTKTAHNPYAKRTSSAYQKNTVSTVDAGNNSQHSGMNTNKKYERNIYKKKGTS